MNKLKLILILFLFIIFSFLISALSSPIDSKEYHIGLSTNIPDKHKIKVIYYGNGSIFANNLKLNNSDIIICKRFSSLDIKIIAHKNYEINSITFDNEDITSSLNSNTITISSITKDAVLKVKFKPSSKKLSLIDNLTYLIKTHDNNLVIIFTLIILFIISLSYIIIYLKRK